MNKVGGSTTFLKCHLKNKHPNELRDAESKQPKINELLQPRLVQM